MFLPVFVRTAADKTDFYEPECQPSIPSSSALADIEDLADPLRRLRAESKQCSCSMCAALCHGTPGCYDPAHIRQMLDAGRDATEFFGTVVQDYWLGEGSAVYYLRPVALGELGGTLADYVPNYGVCSQLTASGCGLPRDQMPIGCAVALPCRMDGLTVVVDKAQAPRVWGTPLGRSVVAEFETVAATLHPGRLLGDAGLRPQMAIAGAEADARINAFVGKKRADVFAAMRRLQQQKVRAVSVLGVPWSNHTFKQVAARPVRVRSHEH
jgi:hypothetical protein